MGPILICLIVWFGVSNLLLGLYVLEALDSYDFTDLTDYKIELVLVKSWPDSIRSYKVEEVPTYWFLEKGTVDPFLIERFFT